MNWAALGFRRVIRGGSWVLAPQYARVAIRSGDDPGRRGRRLGARLVRRVS